MRLIILAALLAVTWSSGRAAQSPVVRYANGQWWTGDRFVLGDRCVAEGMFVRCPGTPPDRIVDLAGRYLIPPLADAHNHVPYDTQRAIAGGVFYLMNPTNLATQVTPPEQRRPAPGKVDVVYSMGAVTAPGGHPEKLYQDILGPQYFKGKKPADFVGDAFHYVTTAADIAPVLDRLVSQNAQFVKIVLVSSEEFARRRDDPAFRGDRGLDPALVPEITREAHRRGLRVAAHIETAADFRVIVAAGVDEAAHMPGYYPVGPYERYAITDADARTAARSGIRMVATAALSLNNSDATKRPAIEAVQGAILRKLKRAGVPILIGTDRRPDTGASEASYLVKLGVLTPVEALNTLTRETPSYIFPGRRIGRLKTGYEASFVVVDRNPSRDIGVLPAAITMRVKQGIEMVAS